MRTLNIGPPLRDWCKAGKVLPIVALFVALTALSGPPAEASQPGQLWLLRQYRVPGCEPMPTVPTVFNWLIRKALAVQEFLAVSADCGQIGRLGAREGWTYVFWSESDDTAVARLLRRGQEKFGITALAGSRPGEEFLVRSSGYEPFVLIQLGGDQGPARVWATGDVASLETGISVAAPGEFQVRVESVTHEGERCVGTRTVRPGEEPSGPRESLPCQPGG